ncbi:hypothetical protein TYRP_016259 [Tyrophagus putrescentiae]|nr:hypothetical protein TYRP_016259 [Tyrophagus putrescentiae]
MEAAAQNRFCGIGEHLIQLRKGGVLGHLLEHANGVGEVLRLQVDRLLQLTESKSASAAAAVAEASCSSISRCFFARRGFCLTPVRRNSARCCR